MLTVTAVDMELHEQALEVLGLLEERFIFRKLGICYDYAATPAAFPLPTLPKARDAAANVPNRAGYGTGMAECTRNHALIFDGYLLRLELGLAGAEEEKILDRLIGGLIRLATVAPKGFLVSGLTPGGSGFYPAPSLEANLFWAFAAYRCVTTAAIAPESQEKIRNIASRWIARIASSRFSLTSLAKQQAEPVDLLAVNGECGPALLAMLAAAAIITGEEKWRDEYARLADEQDRARLRCAPPPSATPACSLLAMQVAMHLIGQFDNDTGRGDLVREATRAVGVGARELLRKFQECKPEILDEEVDFDWHALERGGETLSLPVDCARAGLDIPLAWRRLLHETETVRAAVEAAAALLLGADRELAEPYAGELAALFREVPWGKLVLCGSLAPVPGLHARGVELGLWDQRLAQRQYVLAGMDNLVAAYLVDDFDERHPERAGHTEAVKRKREDDGGQRTGGGGKGNHRRRRNGKNTAGEARRQRGRSELRKGGAQGRGQERSRRRGGGGARKGAGEASAGGARGSEGGGGRNRKRPEQGNKRSRRPGRRRRKKK